MSLFCNSEIRDLRNLHSSKTGKDRRRQHPNPQEFACDGRSFAVDQGRSPSGAELVSWWVTQSTPTPGASSDDQGDTWHPTSDEAMSMSKGMSSIERPVEMGYGMECRKRMKHIVSRCIQYIKLAEFPMPGLTGSGNTREDAPDCPPTCRRAWWRRCDSLGSASNLRSYPSLKKKKTKTKTSLELTYHYIWNAIYLMEVEH